MRRVFLTGGSGFLGGHLLRELRAAGCEVQALSRRPETDAALRALGGVPVRAAIEDPASLQAAIAGCEAVFHAAADTSMWKRAAARQTATNVGGTRHMLAAAGAAGVRAFVHTSSTSAYSHLVEDTLHEGLPERGGQSWIKYERTKFESERLVKAAPLPWIVFNPSHILGPGDRHNWARLILLIDRQALPGIPPGVGSFADVREIAKAQVRAWREQRFGQCYLVGGTSATFVQFVQAVGAMLGRRTPRRTIPTPALMAVARLKDGWSRITGREPDITPESVAVAAHRLRVDSSKAESELGYRLTPLEPLLADTLAWMRAEGMIGRSA
jgi:nucleoside-diphosphate-sugar epimerase